ncbi:MAG: DUF262 domain-containing protein [Terrestrivirus sp.]|uniref:DUF262 domain-containing protein n=1 Tax=Terrestrivirus sp. TaxID=2487775 RepID=A0A3G4ZRT0_9VIRU|nr:MAG: DUF262 domain-containing protein [Terrestrivirus sp.]
MNVFNTIKDILDAAIKGNSKKHRITVPPFQRHSVWNRDKENKLIDSIENNFLINQLTVYKMGTLNNVDTYQLIDGLQRVIAIIKYMNNPLLFEIAKNKINEWKTEFIKKNKISETIGNNLFNYWFTSEIFGNYSEILDKKYMVKYNELIKEVKNHTKSKSDEYVTKLVDQIINKSHEFSTSVRLVQDYKINVQYCDCDPEKLPEQFERMNENVQKASDVETFAASCYRYGFIDINNEEIKECVEIYFNKLNDNLTFFTIDRNNEGTTIYEYIQGLQIHLEEKFDLLETINVKNKKYLFLILQKIFGSHKLVNLAKPMMEEYKKDKFKTMEQMLIKSTEKISSQMNSMLKLKALTKTNIDANLFINIVASYYKNNCKDYEYHRDLFKLFTLYQKIIRDMPETINNNVATFYYTKIDKSDLLKMFEEYEKTFNDNKKEPSVTDKIFLRLLYSGILSYDVLETKECQIEHILPQARLKKTNEDLGIKLPINHIGNLCILDKHTNNKKQQLTLDEYMTDCKKNKIRIKELEDKYLFVSIDKLNIINDKKFNEQMYMNFVNERYQIMKKKFIEQYDNAINNNDDIYDDTDNEKIINEMIDSNNYDEEINGDDDDDDIDTEIVNIPSKQSLKTSTKPTINSPKKPTTSTKYGNTKNKLAMSFN